MQSNHNNQSWRNFQADLKRKNRTQYLQDLIKKTRFWVPVLLVLCLIPVFYLSFDIIFKTDAHEVKPEIPSPPVTTVKEPDNQFLSKTNLSIILGQTGLVNSTNQEIEIVHNNVTYKATTTINPEITRYILAIMEKEKKRKRGNPEDISIVLLDPMDGKILSMTGYSLKYSDQNICLSARFPSASLFKIVTAAAAIEKKGYQAHTKLTFNGSKYTLYKSQLKTRKNKYTNTISFKNAFAQSINPVFGKIGAIYLGKDALQEYAEILGFNSSIPFDIKLEPSIVTFTDTPYQWAEIASGFNRDTLISPLHGALLGSIAITDGVLLEPSVIKTLENENSQMVYEAGDGLVHQAISSRSSAVLQSIMNATVRSGTSKKSFKGYRNDRVLSNLNMGGKTGSIFNKKRSIKYDWFVGFAENKSKNKKLAVGIVVGHGKYIGLRAGDYAKTIFREYFKG